MRHLKVMLIIISSYRFSVYYNYSVFHLAMYNRKLKFVKISVHENKYPKIL